MVVQFAHRATIRYKKNGKYIVTHLSVNENRNRTASNLFLHDWGEVQTAGVSNFGKPSCITLKTK